MTIIPVGFNKITFKRFIKIALNVPFTLSSLLFVNRALILVPENETSTLQQIEWRLLTKGLPYRQDPRPGLLGFKRLSSFILNVKAIDISIVCYSILGRAYQPAPADDAAAAEGAGADLTSIAR